MKLAEQKKKYEKKAKERMDTFIAKTDVTELVAQLNEQLDHHKEELDKRAVITALEALQDETQQNLAKSIKDFSKQQDCKRDFDDLQRQIKELEPKIETIFSNIADTQSKVMVAQTALLTKVEKVEMD